MSVPWLKNMCWFLDMRPMVYLIILSAKRGLSHTAMGVTIPGMRLPFRSDGKILVAGSTTVAAPDLLVLRYEDNGALDSSFENGGIVIFDSELYYSDAAASMVFQPGGKIVIAGTRENNMNADTDVLLLRLLGQQYPPAPASQETFSYPPTVDAEMGTEPWAARPVGVGPVAAPGGNTLRLQVGLSPFSVPVDVYFFIFAPALNEHDMYVFHEDHSLQPLSNGLKPWKRSQLGLIEEGIFGEIPVEALPKGIYNLYLGVTPSGTLDSFYLWSTYFVIPLTEQLLGSSRLQSNVAEFENFAVPRWQGCSPAVMPVANPWQSAEAK